jgi:patatin-like phospholipase/acyl hydrolase
MEESKLTHSANTDTNMGLIGIAASNQNMKTKIVYLLSILESHDLDRMNFFSNYVTEIPDFESLTPEQQKVYLLKFKMVSRSIAGHKIKSTDEMVQVFVFTVLNSLENKNKRTENIVTGKLENKESQSEFRSFLKKAAENEIYKSTIQKPEEETKVKIVNTDILLGIKQAMNHAGLNFNNENVSSNSLTILEDAHQCCKATQHGNKRLTH